MQSILKFLCPHTDDNYKDFIFSLSDCQSVGMAGSRNYTVVVCSYDLGMGGWGGGDYHRRELPQVAFLSRQFCRDKHVLVIVFVATKNVLVATNIVAVATKVCLSR